MKTKKLLITLFLMITIFFNINYVLATDIENTSSDDIEPFSEISDEDLYDTEMTTEDYNEELPTTDFLSTSDITNVSTVNSISEMNLKINNILNIILIALDILLILFAIAILIRLKK